MVMDSTRALTTSRFLMGSITVKPISFFAFASVNMLGIAMKNKYIIATKYTHWGMSRSALANSIKKNKG